MSTNLRPHRAVVLLRIEVSDVLSSGESTNNPVDEKIITEYGLSPKMLITVEGFDMDNCLQKLRAKIDEFKKA